MDPGRRLAKLILWPLAAVVLTAGMLAAWVRSPTAEWPRFGFDQHASFHNPSPTGRLLNDCSLRVAGELPVTEKRSYACRTSDDSNLVLFATRSWRGYSDWASYVVCWDPLGGTDPDTLLEGRLLFPMRPAANDSLRLVSVRTALSYLPCRGVLAEFPGQLFIENLLGEALVSRSQRFWRALRAASRGDSLRVANELVITRADGTVAKTIRLDRRIKIESSVGMLLPARRGPLAVLSSGGDAGQDNGLADLLLHQERLHETTTLEVGHQEARGSFRGLTAIELETDDEVWSRPQGLVSRLHASADINNDGLVELVLGSYSAYQVVSNCGTTDALCCYVSCIDELGHEVWKVRFTGPYMSAQAAIADLSPEPGLEVVAAVRSVEDEVGCIAIISSDGRMLARSEENGPAAGLLVADIVSENPGPEIVTGGTEGRLVVMDRELNTVWCYQDTAHHGYASRRLLPLAVNDLDGDGDEEIAAVSGAWTTTTFRPSGPDRTHDPLVYLVVLGPQLREEMRARVPRLCPEQTFRLAGGVEPSNSMIIDLDGDKLNELVLVWNAFGTVVYEVAE